MRSQRWFANCTAVLLAVCALWASSSARGQYFLDDFEDGSATDDNPVTWLTVPPYDGGTHVIEQGSYVLTPDGISDYPSTSFSELDLLAEGRSFATVSLRTTVRLLSTSLPPDLLIGVLGRHNSGAQGKQAAGVWGAVRSAGRLTLGVFNTQADEDQTWHGTYAPVSSLLVDNDVNLQLDIFADSAALTAWNVGDPRPTRPQIFVRDLPSYAPTEGGVGVWTGQSRSISVRPVAYHYFEAAPIPEPTSLIMAAFAVAGCSQCRIRLRGRRLCCNAGALTLCLLVLAANDSSHAATLFYDDFEDGSATDGSPVTWSRVSAWPQTTIGVDQGDLRIGTSSIDQSAVAGVQNLNLTKTSIRARVRIEGPGDSAAVFVRGNAAVPSAHNLEIAEDGTIWLGLEGQWESVASDLRPLEEDIMLQLDAFGTTITGWAWRAGEPKPADPTYRRTTSRLHTGFPGVYYGDTTSDRKSGVALFRYVHVADASIPEPSTLGLMGVAAAGGMRRSRSNNTRQRRK